MHKGAVEESGWENTSYAFPHNVFSTLLYLNPFTTIRTIRLKNFFEATIGIKTDLNLTALYPIGITKHYKFRFRRYKKQNQLFFTCLFVLQKTKMK